jgi:hypothetical protein
MSVRVSHATPRVTAHSNAADDLPSKGRPAEETHGEPKKRPSNRRIAAKRPCAFRPASDMSLPPEKMSVAGSWVAAVGSNSVTIQRDVLESSSWPHVQRM